MRKDMQKNQITTKKELPVNLTQKNPLKITHQYQIILYYNKSIIRYCLMALLHTINAVNF